MNEPTPEFHAGFSEPTAGAVPWADVERILGSAEIFWLSTVRGRMADGTDVVVEGRAERITDHARLLELAALWKVRHDWNYRVLDDTFDDGAGHIALVFAVRPAKVLAFGKKPHSQTRYRFNNS